MLSRAKPSDWRSIDIDDVRKLFEVEPLYEGGIAGLVSLASPSSPRAAIAMDRALRDIIGDFRVDLHFEDRPTTPQVRAALHASPLAAASAWLRDLDPETRSVLAEAANWHVPDLQRETAEVTGELRLAALLRELEWGARWVRQAEARLHTGKPGRHRRRSVHDAIDRLYEAWRADNARDPKLSSRGSGRTTGPFLDFVRAVLTPPLRAHGIDGMDLEDAVRGRLYR